MTYRWYEQRERSKSEVAILSDKKWRKKLVSYSCDEHIATARFKIDMGPHTWHWGKYKGRDKRKRQKRQKYVICYRYTNFLFGHTKNDWFDY